MASRSRPAISDLRDAEFVDAHAEDVTEQEEASKSEEQAIAAEMGDVEGDARIWFVAHKIVPESRDKIWCMEGTAADLPVTPKLQERFGGGKYHVTIMRDSKYKKRVTLLVAEPRTPVIPPTQSLQGTNDPRLMQLLERLVAQPAPEPSKRLTPTEIIGLVTAGATVLATLKDLFQQPQTNQLEQIKHLVEITESLRSDSAGREPSMMEVIGNVLTNKDLLSNFSGLLTPPNPQALPANPQRQIPQQPTAPTPEQIQQAQMAQVKQQLAMLVGRAQKSSDPGLYAELIADNFDPGLVRQLAQPGAIDFIIALHPPCATFRPWFEQLLTELAEIVNEGDNAGGEASVSEPNPHAGASPVPEPSPASRVVFDTQRTEGYADDAGFDGETGENWEN